MPEFQMQDGEAPDFQKLDGFTRGYIEALFFTECEPGTVQAKANLYPGARGVWNPETESSLPGDVGYYDFAPEAFAKIIADCTQFQTAHADLLERAYEARGYSDEYAGHDFWLTRNGHGAGFWDRGLGEVGDALSAFCGWEARNLENSFGEVDAYLGDDGHIYLT